jgi:hypothetical protein
MAVYATQVCTTGVTRAKVRPTLGFGGMTQATQEAGGLAQSGYLTVAAFDMLQSHSPCLCSLLGSN